MHLIMWNGEIKEGLDSEGRRSHQTWLERHYKETKRMSKNTKEWLLILETQWIN